MKTGWGRFVLASVISVFLLLVYRTCTWSSTCPLTRSSTKFLWEKNTCTRCSIHFRMFKKLKFKIYLIRPSRKKVERTVYHSANKPTCSSRWKGLGFRYNTCISRKLIFILVSKNCSMFILLLLYYIIKQNLFENSGKFLEPSNNSGHFSAPLCTLTPTSTTLTARGWSPPHLAASSRSSKRDAKPNQILYQHLAIMNLTEEAFTSGYMYVHCSYAVWLLSMQLLTGAE
jgi:hypothetical protein